MNVINRIVLIISALAFIVLISFNSFKETAGREWIKSEPYDTQESEKRLVVGRANDSVTLDPSCTTEMDSFKVTVNIFENLVKCEKGGNGIIPCLAESWKSSEDGLNWVFKLRQDVKFHDGTIFDANAVLFNFHRWMDEDNPYHNGPFSYWSYIFGGFPGLVKSVTALNNYSVEIILNKPFAPFLYAMTMPAFGIASPEAIKKYPGDLYEHPVGTGPFIFKSWDRNRSIVLERNNKYWNGDAKVEEVEFKVITENKDRLEELRQGTIHIADYLSPEDIADIKYDPDLYLFFRPSFNIGYMAINNERPPFNNRSVRAAISHGIDKEKLINDVFDNLAKPAITFMPPSLWGYNGSLEVYEYNPEKSRQLLTEAGYPNGFSTTLWVMNASREYIPKPLEAALFIKENLQQVNIDLKIEIFNWNEYLTRMHNGEHEIALIGWTGDYADPDNFLYTMLASENTKPGLVGNYSFYKSNDVDQLLAQARQTTNMSFRRSLYRRLQETVNYDIPSIPLVHTMPVLAARLSVKGYTPHMTGIESLEEVSLEIE